MPSQDEGTRRGQRPQEWWLSSEERQGQPLLTGQIHRTGSQLTGLFFKQDLKQQGQSSPRHGSHSNHVIGKGSDWSRLLQRVLREPSHPDAAVIAEHEAQVEPVSEGKGGCHMN